MSDIRDCKEKAKELLVDMARGGASKEEMEQAIQYSIDVLDANKSYEEHGIAKLEARYQPPEKKQPVREPYISPDEFLIDLQKIWLRYGNDLERAHIAADGLMCNILDSLGYTEGVEFFNNCKKWYS